MSDLIDIDLYEVAKHHYTLPYSKCLSKPLKVEHGYVGYAFSIRLHPKKLWRKAFEIPGNETHVTIKDVMHVKYFQYKLGREDKGRKVRYKLKRLHRRERFVRTDEQAVGPSNALLVAVKASKTHIVIEDVMRLSDKLYSKYDSRAVAKVGQKPLSQYTLDHFQHLLEELDDKRVELYVRRTTCVEKAKKLIRTAYLNIVHDCDRYCAISGLGRFGFVPFRQIKRDGLRCVRALLEKSDVDTYKSRLYSVLNESKGIPYEGERLYNVQQYVGNMQSSVLTKEAQLTVHNETTDSTGTVVAVVSCVLLPTIIGSVVVAYIARSSKFAQTVRNKLSGITHLFNGAQRIVTDVK